MNNQEIIVNVIFDAARGQVSVASREARVGEPLGTLPRPTRAGYRFEGWTLDGTPVDESTVLTGEDDIRLVAVWARKKELRDNSQKASMYRRQRTAVIVLTVVALALVLIMVSVKFMVNIYGITDTYVDAETGETVTNKYYVRKKNGVYGLYDRKGKLMEVNEDGYYIVVGGNQYEVDPETGECELYATVYYDSEGDELLGFGDRVMLFPQIKQKDTYSIEVKNEHGTYTFYRAENGDVKIKGFEESMVSYDPTLYASLCVSCGYTLSMQRLDFREGSAAPRLPDGSIDYAAYGLSEADDPATYTITQAAYESDGSYVASDTKYTVQVGDAILSGGGYYIKRADRDAVFIVSSEIGKTVLQPVEALVTPMVAYPTTVSTYAMVQNFLLGTVDFNGSFEEDIKEDAIDLTVAFTYWDLESRLNSIYSSRPYICTIEDLLPGYEVDSDNATTVLGNLYEMQFIACRKLGITKEALKEYKLGGKVHYLSYDAPVTDENNAIEGYMQSNMIISPKTENGTYYVASFLTDMIVEVDQFYLSFLQWEISDWYEQYFFQYNISDVSGVTFRVGDKKYDFTLDNAASYMYYEADGKMKAIDLEKGSITRKSDGSVIYTDANGTEHKVTRFDFRNGRTELAVLDEKGNTVERVPYEKYLLKVDRDNKAFLRVYDSADTESYREVAVPNVERIRLYYIDPTGDEYAIYGSYNLGGQNNVKYYYRLTYWQEYKNDKGEYDWKRVDPIASSIIFADKNGKEYSPTLGSNNLSVYCDQYEGGKMMDYVLSNTYITDKGVEKTETITATDNFRKLYTMLMWYSIEGDVDPDEFKKNTGLSIEDFIKASADVEPYATFTYRVEDFSTNMNMDTSQDTGKEEDNKDDQDDGNDTDAPQTPVPEIKVWRGNNEREVVVRLYQYTDRKCLLTIEVIELYDKDGNPIQNPVSDPTKATGVFYVLSEQAQEIIQAAERLVGKEWVEER